MTRTLLRPLLWWVRAYTAGLDPRSRDRRREEIAADLWEQAHILAQAGRGPMGTAVRVWARYFVGIVDDVRWRAEEACASRASLPAAVSLGWSTRLGYRGQVAASVLIVGLAIVIAAAISVIDNVQFIEGSEHILSGSTITRIRLPLLVGGIAAAIFGFRELAHRPGVGAAFAVGGPIVAALALHWLVLPAQAVAAVSILAIRRLVHARAATRSRGRRPAGSAR